MSNIRQLAQHLQKCGRYGDTMLVHLNPIELRFLEQVGGAKATTNPDTGLKEAFLPLLIPLIASLVGSVGGAVANKLLTPKQSNTDETSAADNYIKAQGKKALANYSIPQIVLGAPQGAPVRGYTPGVDPEKSLVPSRGSQFGTTPGYAQGGQVPEQAEAQQVYLDAVAALQGGSQDPEAALNRFIQVFGEDKLQQLLAQMQGGGQQQEAPDQGMAHGGLLRGPGGGLDDLMRARTASGQDIALGGGEHVTPADVVSMLGDGSTEAGSRKLTAMEQRVRMAKTGTHRQAGKISPRVMPA